MDVKETKDKVRDIYHEARDIGAEKVDKARDAFRKKRGSIFMDMQSAGKSLPLFMLLMLIFMAFVAASVFFVFVKGPEEVLVPNVVGKIWSDALVQLQEKELYAKVAFRYTSSNNDKGVVLSQSPEPSSIVRGYSRVELVISGGLPPQDDQ